MCLLKDTEKSLTWYLDLFCGPRGSTPIPSSSYKRTKAGTADFLHSRADESSFTSRWVLIHRALDSSVRLGKEARQVSVAEIELSIIVSAISTPRMSISRSSVTFPHNRAIHSHGRSQSLKSLIKTRNHSGCTSDEIENERYKIEFWWSHFSEHGQA